MKKLLITLVAAATLATPAFGQYYVAGDFNGWNAAGNVMTDLGGGIWSVNLSGVGGRHVFKITDGTWANSWPGSGDSWLFGDGSGNVTITFNANDVQDGWRGNWGRIGLSTDPGAWTAVGDWQSWNNTGNSMTAMGGGLYAYQQALAPGWYQWKPVVTGSWDSIGNDFRGINGDSAWFEVTAANSIAVFEVNALAGIMRVTTIPEPSALALLGAGLAGVLWLRRKH